MTKPCKYITANRHAEPLPELFLSTDWAKRGVKSHLARRNNVNNVNLWAEARVRSGTVSSQSQSENVAAKKERFLANELSNDNDCDNSE